MVPGASAKPAKLRPVRALQISSMLAERFRRLHNPTAMKIEPEQVIRVLNRAAAKFVLMGAHGISPWLGEPRATRDIDLLIQKRHHRKAVKAVREAYPALLVEDCPAVTRFSDPADLQVVIDLMKPVEDLHKEVFKYTVAAGKTHCFPTLEMALACKFAAMTSPNRTERKRHLDAADLIGMVEHHFEDIDRNVLFSLGEMVHAGGGPELLKLIDDMHAGRPIQAR
jgi:hypothetical protein